MYDFVQSPLGWFHLVFSIVAMIAGAVVLFRKKGDTFHKKAGYVYVVTMVLVCGSALGIYRLTGSFGVFHVLALVGFATLLGGMVPMFIRTIRPEYQAVHIWFMYYSVLGLYAAFVSELSVRIPDTPFYTMVGIASGSIFAIGTIFILRKEKKWSRHFRTVK